jgi:uroporphyrinogen-III synthase
MKAQYVLVTRPQQQGAEFIQLLKDKGFNSLAFPCIEIKPVELNKELEAVFNALNSFDLIIFVSANAVEQAAIMLHQQNIKLSSITAKIATIGKASLIAAEAAGFEVSISPDKGFNSEALLAHESLQANELQGQHCLIFRGVGGREYLADELRRRGAQVQYAELYQRNKPEFDGEIKREQLSKNWAETGITTVTVTSNESLQNLYDMLEQPGKGAMLETRLIVASQRGVELAQSLGFKSIKLAFSAMNQHMLNAVENGIK